jgi:sugar O-acyltransferase (sialic acid O-acetyltransferase NeuD family)
MNDHRRRQLVVVGAGGFGRETAEAVRAMNAAGTASWRLLGYLDDDPALAGATVQGVAVLGPVSLLAELPEPYVVVCTGRPSNFHSRERIVHALGLPSCRYATIVHPSASVSESSRIGAGSVLLASVVLTAAVTIGSHVAVMPHVTMTHDDVVEDFSTIASGVRLGGGVRIASGAYLGAGALVREHLTIGAGALVGMGAVVTTDVPGEEVWAGVPARHFRSLKVSAGTP